MERAVDGCQGADMYDYDYEYVAYMVNSWMRMLYGMVGTVGWSDSPSGPS